MFEKVAKNNKKLKELEEEYQCGVYDRELELDEEEPTLKDLSVEIEEYNCDLEDIPEDIPEDN